MFCLYMDHESSGLVMISGKGCNLAPRVSASHYAEFSANRDHAVWGTAGVRVDGDRLMTAMKATCSLRADSDCPPSLVGTGVWKTTGLEPCVTHEQEEGTPCAHVEARRTLLTASGTKRVEDSPCLETGRDGRKVRPDEAWNNSCFNNVEPILVENHTFA